MISTVSWRATEREYPPSIPDIVPIALFATRIVANSIGLLSLSSTFPEI